MANPLRVLRSLVRLGETAGDELGQPETVSGGLLAVGELLRNGLPGKDQIYEQGGLPDAIKTLAATYRARGQAAPEQAEGASAPAGDRLHRSDMLRLAEGLADVADRLELAALLRDARRKAGYSIRELARVAGVDHSYVSRVERGAVPRPSGAVMARLSGPLGLPGDTGTASELSLGLAELGLQRAGIRALLKILRDLPDSHLELLSVQARAMRDQVRKGRRTT